MDQPDPDKYSFPQFKHRAVKSMIVDSSAAFSQNIVVVVAEAVVVVGDACVVVVWR